jgi:hypothetical protein
VTTSSVMPPVAARHHGREQSSADSGRRLPPDKWGLHRGLLAIGLCRLLVHEVHRPTPSSGGPARTATECSRRPFSLTTMNKRATAMVMIIGLASGAALAGCSSQTPDAAEVTDAAEAPDRNAGGFRPTQVCLINNSSSRTEAEFTMADSADEKQVLWENLGDRMCGVGSSSTQIIDVKGTFLTTNPDRTWNFGSGNRAIRLPGINVGYTEDGQYHSCIGQELSIGESASFDDGFVTVTATRRPDTSAKEFEIILSDSTKPSTTGTARTCRTVN